MPHRPQRLVPCLLATSAALGATCAPAVADPLGTLASAHPARPVEVIVQVDRSQPLASGRIAVRRRGGRVTGQVRLIHAVSARLHARAALRLRRDPAVSAVTPNGRIRPQGVSTRDLQTAYPFAAAASTEWNSNGATGDGVGVAVIDTGIAGDLPDFRTAPGDDRSRVVGSAVINPGATTAEDEYGHGTHVAGIIAGNGQLRSDAAQGQYIGVAPDADLVSIKVSDDGGAASVLDVIYGLQFAVDHRDEFNIRVVNLSVTSTTPGSATTDPLDAAAEAAWFSGITVVAAAGNRGTAQDAVLYAPGNDPFVITVGASDDRATRSRGDDGVASWSSRGTTQDGYAKPDLYAPGAHIVSTLAPGSAFAGMCPTCVVAGSYFQAGGTSMAAPVVAGVAALVLQRHPGLTPDQLKGLLVRSARPLASGEPAVSADAAVKAAGSSWLPPANQGLAPNTSIDPVSDQIDYTKSSWSRSSWSTSSPGLTADWARSSWSCACALTADGPVDTTRSSWSRSSWSTSWDR